VTSYRDYQCASPTPGLAPLRLKNILPPILFHNTGQIHYHLRENRPLRYSGRIPRVRRCLQQVQSRNTRPPPSLRPPNQLRKRFPPSSRNYLFIIQIRTGSAEGIHRRKPHQWIHLLNIFTSWSSGPVRKKERWFSPALCRFLWSQQDHEEGSIPTSSHFRPLRFPLQSSHLHQDRPLACVPFGPHCRGR